MDGSVAVTLVPAGEVRACRKSHQELFDHASEALRRRCLLLERSGPLLGRWSVLPCARDPLLGRKGWVLERSRRVLGVSSAAGGLPGGTPGWPSAEGGGGRPWPKRGCTRSRVAGGPLSTGDVVRFRPVVGDADRLSYRRGRSVAGNAVSRSYSDGPVPAERGAQTEGRLRCLAPDAALASVGRQQPRSFCVGSREVLDVPLRRASGIVDGIGPEPRRRPQR